MKVNMSLGMFRRWNVDIHTRHPLEIRAAGTRGISLLFLLSMQGLGMRIALGYLHVEKQEPLHKPRSLSLSPFSYAPEAMWCEFFLVLDSIEYQLS